MTDFEFESLKKFQLSMNINKTSYIITTNTL